MTTTDNLWLKSLMDHTVALYLDDVKAMARKYARRLPPHFDVDDLISAGSEGLLSAIRTFSIAFGRPFWPFAHLRIRGAMQDYVRSQDFVPNSIRRKITREAAESDAGDADYKPTSKTSLPTRVLVYVEDFAAALQISGSDALSQIMSVEPQIDQERRAIARQELAILKKRIQKLPKNWRLVVRGCLFDEKTYKEVAAKAGISEVRVCQLVNKSLQRLRAPEGDQL